MRSREICGSRGSAAPRRVDSLATPQLLWCLHHSCLGRFQTTIAPGQKPNRPNCTGIVREDQVDSCARRARGPRLRRQADTTFERWRVAARSPAGGRETPLWRSEAQRIRLAPPGARRSAPAARRQADNPLERRDAGAFSAREAAASALASPLAIALWTRCQDSLQLERPGARVRDSGEASPSARFTPPRLKAADDVSGRHPSAGQAACRLRGVLALGAPSPAPSPKAAAAGETAAMAAPHAGETSENLLPWNAAGGSY